MANLAETIRARPSPVPAGGIETIRSSLKGQVCVKGEPGYDEARTIWNAMIDRSPGVVIRCAEAADVIGAVRFANAHDLDIAVRGGGHNIAGNAVCEGGLLIDLTPMKAVRVDPAARRAWVDPGCTLGDVDRETQAFGLAVPTGINSTTGIAGLTLGGGFGWLTRPFGMTVDNLVGADVVTAEGEMVHASETENPDLFWALRGGGGNFGIVTSFEFKLHKLGPEVFSGLIVHPFEDAATLLKQYRKIADEAPNELTIWTVMRKAPPLPFVPAEWHGREVFIFAAFYAGSNADGEKATKSLRALGHPIVDVLGPHPFIGWQSAFDPLLTPGARNYWKTHDFATLPDGAIDAITGAVSNLPGPECEVFMAHVGGAMAHVAKHSTAYPYRDAHFIMNVHTRWREAADDGKYLAWARSLYKATEPFATGSAYVNFMPADDTGKIGEVYGDNYRRLVEVKRRWDPKNRFHINHNINPAG
ncbi:FAD-binding oxidoreductase [Mesorhizobium koreense]|uniref:FAD-binding oxidoreductase n=1 Tax=Mesorhizobium koreense TaxID=3074855 RepID=UPI00287BC266|nr:FAD-binding oxidoreductase [Mesorhizobium sp. WR6]